MFTNISQTNGPSCLREAPSPTGPRLPLSPPHSGGVSGSMRAEREGLPQPTGWGGVTFLFYGGRVGSAFCFLPGSLQDFFFFFLIQTFIREVCGDGSLSWDTQPFSSPHTVSSLALALGPGGHLPSWPFTSTTGVSEARASLRYFHIPPRFSVIFLRFQLGPFSPVTASFSHRDRKDSFALKLPSASGAGC